MKNLLLISLLAPVFLFCEIPDVYHAWVKYKTNSSETEFYRGVFLDVTDSSIIFSGSYDTDDYTDQIMTFEQYAILKQMKYPPPLPKHKEKK